MATSVQTAGRATANTAARSLLSFAIGCEAAHGADLGCLNWSGRTLCGCGRPSASGIEAFRRAAIGLGLAVSVPELGWVDACAVPFGQSAAGSWPASWP